MANEDKDNQDYSGGLEALLSAVPDQAIEPEHDKLRGPMEQKICPKCPGSQVMDAAHYIAIIPAMNNENFVNAEKISRTGGFPVRAFECPNCHFVELYRAL